MCDFLTNLKVSGDKNSGSDREGVLREPGAVVNLNNPYVNTRKLIQLNQCAASDNNDDILEQLQDWDRPQLRTLFLKLFSVFKHEIKEDLKNELKADYEPKRKKSVKKAISAKSPQNSNSNSITIETHNKFDALVTG